MIREIIEKSIRNNGDVNKRVAHMTILLERVLQFSTSIYRNVKVVIFFVHFFLTFFFKRQKFLILVYQIVIVFYHEALF